MNTDTKELTANCHNCAKHSSQQCTETLHNDLVTTQPWIALSCDLFEYQCKIYPIVVDLYSKFIAVEPVADHLAKKTVNAFLQIFSKLGTPTTICCDHGANLTSQMFIAFCSNLDLSLSYSDSFDHSSNTAERAVITVKNMMKKFNCVWILYNRMIFISYWTSFRSQTWLLLLVCLGKCFPCNFGILISFMILFIQ